MVNLNTIIDFSINSIIQIAMVIIAGYLIVCGILYNLKYRKEYILTKYSTKKELYLAKIEYEKAKKAYKDWILENGDTLHLFDKESKKEDEVETDKIEELSKETSEINKLINENNEEIDIPNLSELLEKEGKDFFKHSLRDSRPKSYYRYFLKEK